MNSSLLLLVLVAVMAVSVSAFGLADSSTGAAPVVPSTTICDRLTTKLGLDNRNQVNEYTAIRTLILAVATGTNSTLGLFNNPITKNFFNGAINYRRSPYAPYQPSPFPGNSPNFNVAGADQASLVDHLTLFFGNALGCTASGFSKYSSSYNGVAFNQYQLHANMNITKSVFSAFNSEVSGAAATFSLSQDDLATVSAFLLTFNRNNANPANMICSTQSCDCAPQVTGNQCDQASPASTVQVSFVTLLVAAFLAVFATRQ